MGKGKKERREKETVTHRQWSFPAPTRDLEQLICRTGKPFYYHREDAEQREVRDSISCLPVAFPLTVQSPVLGEKEGNCVSQSSTEK